MTLQQVRTTQPEWFSYKNKRFFGDISYRVLHGKRTGNPYLVRATYAWTDMFGSPRRLHYRINQLSNDGTIGDLIEREFDNLSAVKVWLTTEPDQ